MKPICQGCGHPVVHQNRTGDRKVRTKMVIVKSDELLVVACPKCREDVILGFLSQEPPSETLARRSEPKLFVEPNC